MPRGNRLAKKFRRLPTISTLSTGLVPNISLLRLGTDVHGDQVIGTAVPASLGRSATARRGRQGQRSDLRRQAMLRLFGVETGQVGTRRRKSSVFLARRGSKHFGVESEAGRERAGPKKGRRISDGFDFGQAGRLKERRSSGLSFGRPVWLLARESSSVGSDA